MTLRDRCNEFAAKISPAPDADDLYAFVLSEIGRAASDKLADSNALVLFFGSPEGAQEVADAIHEAMPGLVEKQWPR